MLVAIGELDRRTRLTVVLFLQPHIARCLIPDAAFTAVPCSPIPASPQSGTPMWRPVSAPVINEATQVEFSPRNLPKDQSLLSYDSDNSVASDPGYTAVRRPGRMVEQAEVVIETSPTGRVSGERDCLLYGTVSGRELYYALLYLNSWIHHSSHDDSIYCIRFYVDLDNIVLLLPCDQSEALLGKHEVGYSVYLQKLVWL